MRRFIFVYAYILSSCTGPGLLSDGSSVSLGNHATGILRHGRSLSLRGEGYRIPQRWAERKRNYGSDELITLIRRVARRVYRKHGGILGVADISPLGGGPTKEHGSHRSGRDVDFLYYALDANDRPIVPLEMIHFDSQGQCIEPRISATQTTSLPTSIPSAQLATLFPCKLDLKRNWEMLEALVTDPEIPVQWIFIGNRISKQLLAYAEKQEVSKLIIARVKNVIRQPGDASPHTDHIHVRIFCSFEDRYQGCIDRGPSRFMLSNIEHSDEPEPMGYLGEIEALLWNDEGFVLY